MRRMLRVDNLPALFVAVLALIVAVAGVSFAAGGGGSKKITACVSKSGGALYQAKKCKKHDKKLTWNQQGLQGAAGATGANGANGTNGKDGAVAGYSAKGGLVEFTGETKQVLKLSLPAGSFIVQGKTQVGGSATSAGYMNDSCTLADGSASSHAQFSAPFTPAQFLTIRLDETSLPMEIAVTSSSPSTVTLTCEDVSHEGTAFSTGASDSVITAVQTSSNS